MSQTVIEWSDQLALGNAIMDETHREFIDLLNRVAAAQDADLLARVDEFIVHTEAHFGQEEHWMEASSFPPLYCHRGEHARVLETAREVRKRIEAGDAHLGRMLAEALAEWFAQHAMSMDAMLADYMQQTSYLPERRIAP